MGKASCAWILIGFLALAGLACASEPSPAGDATESGCVSGKCDVEDADAPLDGLPAGPYTFDLGQDLDHTRDTLDWGVPVLWNRRVASPFARYDAAAVTGGASVAHEMQTSEAAASDPRAFHYDPLVKAWYREHLRGLLAFRIAEPRLHRAVRWGDAWFAPEHLIALGAASYGARPVRRLAIAAVPLHVLLTTLVRDQGRGFVMEVPGEPIRIVFGFQATHRATGGGPIVEATLQTLRFDVQDVRQEYIRVRYALELAGDGAIVGGAFEGRAPTGILWYPDDTGSSTAGGPVNPEIDPALLAAPFADARVFTSGYAAGTTCANLYQPDTWDVDASNDAAEGATRIGEAEDTDRVFDQSPWLDSSGGGGDGVNFRANLWPRGDSDWYAVHVADTNAGTLEPRLRFSKSLDIPSGVIRACGYYRADSGATTVQCGAGTEPTAESTLGVAGCCVVLDHEEGFWDLAFDVESTSGDETGTMWVNVTTVDPADCGWYRSDFHF